MDISRLSTHMSATTGISRSVQILMVISILTNFALGISLAAANRTHRETMVPPTISKTFWVDDEKVSPEYLEQMGAFLLQLAVNNTPVNAEYNARQLLKYAAPASYGELEASLLGNAQRLKRDNASTFFAPRAVTIDPNSNSVSFNGVQTTYVSDRRVSEGPAHYTVRLAYSGGKVYVLDLRATDPKTPFAPLPAESASTPLPAASN